MFEQDVAGLIKALRNKGDESKVIQQALDETRKEIKSRDADIKAAALLKLIYLEMLGNSMAWAAFAVVECMSSPKYHIKAIGYLAASQCFDRDTEVALLVVNLIRKDLLSPPTATLPSSPTSLTVAHLMSTLSAVSQLATPSLAHDLAPDLLSLLTHSRAQVRKQVTLVLWRLYKSWPGVADLRTGREEIGQDPWIERLRERLQDEDVTVVGATVNLLCELVRKEPRRYLELAPELFGLLTSGTSNWMVIKLVKIFSYLMTLEPRLIKKLTAPLTEIIETTPAMSLLYECIQTAIVGGMLNGREGAMLAQTCIDKLKSFLEDSDQNLRYIALVALVKISPTHPHLISTHHDVILACADDPDASIRLRALDLVETMVERRTLRSIVDRFKAQLRSPSSSTSSAAASLRAVQNGTPSIPSANSKSSSQYRATVAALILRMCAANSYANVSNFEWLTDTLVELASLSRALDQHDPAVVALAARLRDTIIDVGARVKGNRPYLVKAMASLLTDESLLEEGSMSEVLVAASWICGEYCSFVNDSRPLIATLFGTFDGLRIPGHVLASFLHNGAKIYASWFTSLAANWSDSDVQQANAITKILEDRLKECSASEDASLREVSSQLAELLQVVDARLEVLAATPTQPEESEGEKKAEKEHVDKDARAKASALAQATAVLESLFFSYELNPVNPRAQSMVEVPENLDLETPRVARETLEQELEAMMAADRAEVDDYGRPLRPTLMSMVETEPLDAPEGKKKKKKNKEAKQGKGEKKRKKKSRVAEDDDIDSIPVVQLSLDDIAAARPRSPTPPLMHVDVEGELPPSRASRPSSTPTPQPVESPQITEQSPGDETTVTKVVKKKRRKEKTRT